MSSLTAHSQHIFPAVPVVCPLEMPKGPAQLILRLKLWLATRLVQLISHYPPGMGRTGPFIAISSAVARACFSQAA